MPLKGLKVREESEGSPGPKAKVQRIVQEVTSARDRKSKVRKTKVLKFLLCGLTSYTFYYRSTDHILIVISNTYYILITY